MWFFLHLHFSPCLQQSEKHEFNFAKINAFSSSTNVKFIHSLIPHYMKNQLASHPACIHIFVTCINGLCLLLTFHLQEYQFYDNHLYVLQLRKKATQFPSRDNCTFLLCNYSFSSWMFMYFWSSKRMQLFEIRIIMV